MTVLQLSSVMAFNKVNNKKNTNNDWKINNNFSTFYVNQNCRKQMSRKIPYRQSLPATPTTPPQDEAKKKNDKKFMNCVNNVQRNKYKTYPTIEWLYYGWGWGWGLVDLNPPRLLHSSIATVESRM